jgi:hypothetical protein
MATIKQVQVEDDAEESAIVGRAMKVASALSARRTDEFAKPGNLVEVRFVKGQSLSLTAARLLALMILSAGGEAWRDTAHRMRKADIRRGHKGNERISDMLEELHRTLFAEDDRSWRGKKAVRKFSLIQMSKEEAEDEDGMEAGWIEWQFTPDARRLIQESETYAVLNRQAVLKFRSAYALKLYELGALRIHRRQPVWRCDMPALRAALGIAPDIYKDFAQLRRKVLETAKAEIDQVAHFFVEWQEVRQGRTIVELVFRFVAKDAPAQIGTVDELARHSGGRRPRREGGVEQLAIGERLEAGPTDTERVPPGAIDAVVAKVASAMSAHSKKPYSAPYSSTFPTSSLRWSVDDELLRIGRDHGGGWDVDLIADAYRSLMGDRLARLTGTKMLKSWRGFCESYVARAGRPT